MNVRKTRSCFALNISTKKSIKLNDLTYKRQVKKYKIYFFKKINYFIFKEESSQIFPLTINDR